MAVTYPERYRAVETWPKWKAGTEMFNIAQTFPGTSSYSSGIGEVRAMIDQFARSLLYILRSTQYLAWHYRESWDGPKMRQLKRALIEAIAELELEVANLPASRIRPRSSPRDLQIKTYGYNPSRLNRIPNKVLIAADYQRER